ncbi:hypothetical protein COCON_G00089940 [Conger conger]|uniref:Insulin receptor substrate 1 n=1 Tax=Conger conger TaxID=82655 RepID=A0A9Q1HYZ3_CONCO|nr:hypothetical protein COCON_G00089940 [Conger conger]
MHKRFFVLRIASASGPSRLEYYENEKKWRHKSVAPKRSIPLESCFNINKRADSKNKYLVALYTKEEYFAVAADNEQEQDMWYQALLDLHNRGKLLHGPAGGGNGGTGGDSYGAEATPGPAFKEVWQVVLKPKGLGHAKNLIGIYRLCLTNKTISLVKLNSDAAAVVLQLMNIRRCGHSESFFFVEVGRSAITGPGEFWMQADDSVVAQNMHETILEAMKAMSEEFHPRSKSQGSSNRSTPISVPLRRHHHHGHAPPSQVGLGRRSRAESAAAASPAAPGRQTRSFRVRASSDGEGTMSRPASADGSPVSPSSARGASSQRRRTLTSARLHPPLTHSRSIPTPSSTTSPVSLSSCSSTSGHGSASDCPYPRRPSATPSGSPSDGGFVSSDEYGSSPGDFRGSSFRSATPDSSLGHTPPAREEELNNYIYMARPGLTAVATATAAGRLNPNPALTRRLSPPHLEELEKSFRKRTHTPPPASTCHQKTPSQSSLDEYAAMTPGCRHPDLPPVTSYPGETLDLHVEHGGARLGAGTGLGARLGDDGYMPMSPGAAPASSHKSDDYMPMSPKTVSAPQQILGPRSHCRVDSSGYMMMSPENGGGGECVKAWSSGGGRGGADPPEGKGSYGDYISMSPGSSSATSTPPPDCYLNPPPPPAEEAPPTPGSCYYSLPRSYRRAPGKQSQLRVALGPGRPAYPESSSSSASSDSLGPQDTVGRPLGVRSAGRPQVRPTRLSLDCARASTLPRARDSPFPSPEPHSPGEYVSMEFGDRPFCASLASLLAPVFTEDSSFLEGGTQCPSEYGNLELEAGRTHPGFEGKDFALGNLASVVPGTGPALGTLSAFSRVRPNPDQNQGARVVRVDPQARQRHGSGTFGPELGGRTTQPQLQVSQEGTKLHSCSSFEDAWPSPRDPVSGRGERAPVAGTASSSSSSSSSAHNLNYMDLDLGKVLEQSEWSFLPPECPQRLVEPPTEEGNGYASVSFRKPERANNDPSHREE